MQAAFSYKQNKWQSSVLWAYKVMLVLENEI